jgi:hypothetical protein
VHDETLVVVDPAAADPDRPVAIVPLMDRHAVEASDADTHTMIRHADQVELTAVEPTDCVVYFGGTYHADYATMLAHPANMPGAAQALAAALVADEIAPAAGDPEPPEHWSAVDLRRLRQADPAADALATALGEHEIARAGRSTSSVRTSAP